MENTKIKYNEVDFLVPTQKFNIRFSYVTKKGLPFIREFVLRLLHICPVKASKLKEFFDFSEKELEEAVQDLVDKGDIYLSVLGELELTEQAKGYFDDLGSQPTLSAVLDYSESLTYEMIGMNCLGTDRKTSSWRNGISLKADKEKLSQSEIHVNQKFQQEFYQYLDNGWMSHLTKGEKTNPSIYSIDLIKKIGQGPISLNIEFELDSDGTPIEFGNLSEFTDSSQIEIAVGKRLTEFNFITNFDAIVKSMMALDDNSTINYFSSSTINVSKLIQDRNDAFEKHKSHQPLIGQVYSLDTTEVITKEITTFIERIKKIKKFDQRKLIWISPTDSVWGATSKTSKLWSTLEKSSLVSDGKQNQRAYEPELYLPLSDKGDRRTIAKWLSEFGEKKTLFGLNEGFLEGNTEVMILDGVFALVNYHVVLPDYSPLPVPIGFITKDLGTVNKIKSIVDDYLGDIKSYENPNNLGKLLEL